jgi:hypothetical protein
VRRSAGNQQEKAVAALGAKAKASELARTGWVSPAPIFGRHPRGLQVGRSDPHYSSGNGRNGQASWLSFAAACGWLKVGSMAALTASSNRSNSTSLIALFECAGTIRIAIIHKIDASLLAVIATFSSLQEVEKPELSRSSYGPDRYRSRGLVLGTKGGPTTRTGVRSAR